MRSFLARLQLRLLSLVRCGGVSFFGPTESFGVGTHLAMGHKTVLTQPCRMFAQVLEPRIFRAEPARIFREVKKKFPAVSYSDLWIFAACVAVEEMGGAKAPACGSRFSASRLLLAEKNIL